MKLSNPTLGPIVGYTSHSQSRIWFRGQFEQTGESTYRRCFGVLHFRKRGAKKWSSPLFNKMSPNFDMTCVLGLQELEPETEYQYQVGWLTLDAELSSITEFQASLIEWPDIVYSFCTGAADATKERSYAVGSCRYLLKTFIGDIFDDRGDKVFKSIVEQYHQRPIHGLMMVGDQIYADDLNFLAPDTCLPEFLKRYRTVFSQEHIRQLMAKIPTYMILDDHEIEDNWPAKATEEDKVKLYPQAIHAYQIYQCSHSPLFDVGSDGRIDGILQKFWYVFCDGCVDWFVMDCRTERITNGAQRRMIKSEQLEALLGWLRDNSGKVKVVVTSVPFVPDLLGENEDKWGGFPDQRDAILDAIASLNSPKVVFVSGDVHCSFAAEIRLKDRASPIAYQVVSSSFFWPYPHMEANDFQSDGPLESAKSASNFSARILSPVYSEDNFVRLDISVNRIGVSFFKRKGDSLGDSIQLDY